MTLFDWQIMIVNMPPMTSSSADFSNGSSGSGSIGRTPPNSNSKKHKGFIARFIEKHLRHHGNLAEGLEQLNSQMGLSNSSSERYVPPEATVKTPTENHARSTIYAPDMDGQADPGEVVWADIRPRRGEGIQRRAVLIIGRNRHTLLTLLISSNEDHSDHSNWLPIGPGAWDMHRADSWVRVDKILEIPESQILRRGVHMPERRYDRIAQLLRKAYGWH